MAMDEQKRQAQQRPRDREIFRLHRFTLHQTRGVLVG
jgi:hypothetical protein